MVTSKTLLKSSIFLLVFVLLHATTFGATYTASTSGDWTSSATWAGGTAPSTTITGDQVIIPSGITVNLGSNLTVNGALASLAINGSLQAMAADSIFLGSGALTGAGTINAGALVLTPGSTLAFTGTLVVSTLINMSVGLAAVAHATVSQTLVLLTSLSVNTGGTLSLDSGSTIIIGGGSLATGGGTVTLTHEYNVMYVIATAHAGLELTGAGLINVTVNVPSADSVYLAANTTVEGTLTVTAGTLSLNGHDLTLNGSIGTGSGTISSTGASSISINMTSGPAGALTFSANGGTVNNFTLNMSTGADFALGSDLTVNGTLTLTAGHLDLQSMYALDIAAGGSITGASSSNYVIATGNAYLGMNVTAGASGWTTYPVGTLDFYTPAAVQLNSGSATQDVDVSVAYGVKAQGTTGTDLSLSDPAVKITWFIEPDNAAQANANLQVMWTSNLEVNGFNHDSAYLSHFTGGAWDQSTVMAATSANGMFSLQRNNVSSFSPFAVFGKGASVGINEVNADANVRVYPSPAAEELQINILENTGNLKADILDLTGKVIGTYNISGSNATIPVETLSHGNYFIKLYNDKFNIVKSFAKL